MSSNSLKMAASPSVLVLGAFITTTIYLVCRSIYRVYFHPLSKYPGPPLWAATRLPHFYNALKGTYSQHLVTLHEQYGSTVRIAPNELSSIDGRVWKDVYAHRQGHDEFHKDELNFSAPPNGVRSMLSASRENHQRYRRLFSHAFSEKGLREQEPLIRQYIDAFINGLRGHEGEAVDMVKWLNWTTFDIIGDLAFGDPFNCLRDEKSHPWIESVFGSVKAIPFTGFLRAYGLLPLMMLLMPANLKKARQENFEYARDKATKREKLGKDRGDFLDHVLKHEYPKGLTSAELVSNSSLLVLGGSETTATALSGLTWYITHYERVYQKLADEIRTAFKSDEEINLLNVGHLEYLGAVIQETLRCYPPVPDQAHRVVPGKGDTVLGEWVPGGTIISIAHYAAYHSPLNFASPNTFLPERHLPSSSTHPNNPSAIFQPFGVGPRNCIGQNLAWQEMRLIVAKLLFNFDIALDAEKTGDWTQQKIFFLWEKRPLWVKVTPRR